MRKHAKILLKSLVKMSIFQELGLFQISFILLSDTGKFFNLRQFLFSVVWLDVLKDKPLSSGKSKITWIP